MIEAEKQKLEEAEQLEALRSESYIAEIAEDGKKKTFIDAIDEEGRRVIKQTIIDLKPVEFNVKLNKITYEMLNDEDFRNKAFSDEMLNRLDEIKQKVAEAKADGLKDDEALTIHLETEKPHKEENTTFTLQAWEEYIKFFEILQGNISESVKAVIEQANTTVEEALQEMEAAKKAEAEAKKKAEAEEKKRKKAEREKLKLEARLEREDLFNLPTSPATELYDTGLTLGKDLDKIPAKKPYNRNDSYMVLEKEKARRLQLTTRTGEITLEVEDIDALDITGKAEKNLFHLALILISKQALHNGELSRESVTFPLQKLIDLGMYSDMKSARRGFDNAMHTLTSLKIGGKYETGKGKGKKSVTTAIAVLFPLAERKNGQCTIYLNKLINWNFIASYFTLLPACYFSLEVKAKDLLKYIFVIARQRTKMIREKGYFTISLEALQDRLKLPALGTTRKLKEYILDPIETAIQTINESAPDILYIEPSYSKAESSTLEILKEGYVKITLRGKAKDYYTTFSKEIEEAVEKANERQRKIVDNAKAIKMSKNIGEDE